MWINGFGDLLSGKIVKEKEWPTRGLKCSNGQVVRVRSSERGFYASVYRIESGMAKREVIELCFGKLPNEEESNRLDAKFAK